MTWSACDRALMKLNFHSTEIGWEQYEEILLRVRVEIEGISVLLHTSTSRAADQAARDAVVEAVAPGNFEAR